MSDKTADSIQGVYRHYKGQHYRVLGLARHSETLEPLVLYEADYDNPLGKVWVRPQEMFFSKVLHEGREVERFAYERALNPCVSQKAFLERYLCYAECIIESQGEFLVITRPQGSHAGGLLAFPGGKLERTDNINSDVFLAAAKREIAEEVGIELKDQLQYVTSNFFIDQDQNPVLSCVFYCKILDDRPAVVSSPREVPEYKWLSREEINLHPHSPPWIKRYLSMIRVFESIEIVAPNDKWAASFLMLNTKLLGVIGFDCPIEHIGSTAVPGLAAKDIIDIQLGVESFGNISSLIEKLVSLGLTYSEDFKQDHIPLRPMEEFSPEWEKRFASGTIDGIKVNLHIRKVTNPNWQYALLFRDFLKANPSVATAYAQLKLRLSELPISRYEYTYAKDPAVDLIYLQARDWAQKIGWKCR